FKDFLPSAKSAHGRFNDLAAKANRNVALLTRKMGKLMSIFVTTRKVREQILYRFDAETAQREKFRARDPIEFSERLRDFDALGERSPRRPGDSALAVGGFCFTTPPHCIGPVLPPGGIFTPRTVSPSYSSARIRNAMSHGAGGNSTSAESK